VSIDRTREAPSSDIFFSATLKTIGRLFYSAVCAGKPDGIILNQKSQFGKILEGSGMENVGIFNGHYEYISAIWYCI
jgi:hypothetical protein